MKRILILGSYFIFERDGHNVDSIVLFLQGFDIEGEWTIREAHEVLQVFCGDGVAVVVYVEDFWKAVRDRAFIWVTDFQDFQLIKEDGSLISVLEKVFGLLYLDSKVVV